MPIRMPLGTDQPLPRSADVSARLHHIQSKRGSCTVLFVSQNNVRIEGGPATDTLHRPLHPQPEQPDARLNMKTEAAKSKLTTGPIV